MQSKACMQKYLDGIHATGFCETSLVSNVMVLSSIVLFPNVLAEQRLEFCFYGDIALVCLKSKSFCCISSSQNKTKLIVLHSQDISIGRGRGYIHALRPKEGAKRLIPPSSVASFPTKDVIPSTCMMLPDSKYIAPVKCGTVRR